MTASHRMDRQRRFALGVLLGLRPERLHEFVNATQRVHSGSPA